MREKTTVIEINNDLVTVEKIREEACSTCSSKNVCQPFGEKKIAITVRRNDVEVNVGDEVEIEIPEFSATKLALLIYAMPLTVFLTVLMTMLSLGLSELFSTIGGAIGMVSVYAILAIYDRRNRKRLTPVILKRVGK